MENIFLQQKLTKTKLRQLAILISVKWLSTELPGQAGHQVSCQSQRNHSSLSLVSDTISNIPENNTVSR